MAELLQRRGLFLHIQKTAGTSIVNAVRAAGVPDVPSHGDCWGQDPARFMNHPFVSGHIGYDYAHALMKDRYSFVFLRDPVERILSMYYFCRSRDPGEFRIYQRANELGLEDFLAAGFSDPWVRKNIWNNQVWQLAHGYAHLDGRTIDKFDQQELLSMALVHLREFSFVGFTESLEQDRVDVLDALGLDLPEGSGRANEGPDRPGTEELSDSAKASLKELTALDRVLYDEALSIRHHSGSD